MSEKIRLPVFMKSSDALCSLTREFCQSVINGGYKILPTRTEFCRYVADAHNTTIDRVDRAIDLLYPQCGEKLLSMVSDIFLQGGALGHYQQTVITLALKNLCGWVDRSKEDRNDGEKNDDMNITISVLPCGTSV